MAAVGAFTSMAQAEDLKAFERRLVECISSLRPVANRWRLVLVVSLLFTLVTSWNWLVDQRTTQVSLVQSLLYHKLFVLSLVVLLGLLATGLHKRIAVQSVVVSRSKRVLQDFNMSCDDRGRLILKPRLKEADMYQRGIYQGYG